MIMSSGITIKNFLHSLGKQTLPFFAKHFFLQQKVFRARRKFSELAHLIFTGLPRSAIALSALCEGLNLFIEIVIFVCSAFLAWYFPQSLGTIVLALCAFTVRTSRKTSFLFIGIAALCARRFINLCDILLIFHASVSKQDFMLISRRVNHHRIDQFLKSQQRKAMFAFLRSVKNFLIVMPELIISFIPTVSQD